MSGPSSNQRKQRLQDRLPAACRKTARVRWFPKRSRSQQHVCHSPSNNHIQQCTHPWGCVSKAILQMSLLCPLFAGWAGCCVCVTDTRRHGWAACDISAAVSFMQLHCCRQDTSNHAHPATTVCVWGGGQSSMSQWHTAESKASLHPSPWIRSAGSKQVCWRAQAMYAAVLSLFASFLALLTSGFSFMHK